MSALTRMCQESMKGKQLQFSKWMGGFKWRHITWHKSVAIKTSDHAIKFLISNQLITNSLVNHDDLHERSHDSQLRQTLKLPHDRNTFNLNIVSWLQLFCFILTSIIANNQQSRSLHNTTWPWCEWNRKCVEFMKKKSEWAWKERPKVLQQVALTWLSFHFRSFASLSLYLSGNLLSALMFDVNEEIYVGHEPSIETASSWKWCNYPNSTIGIWLSHQELLGIINACSTFSALSRSAMAKLNIVWIQNNIVSKTCTAWNCDFVHSIKLRIDWL